MVLKPDRRPSVNAGAVPPDRYRSLQASLDAITEVAQHHAPAGEPTIDALRRAIEPVPFAVLVFDDAGRYVLANDQACRLTGYSTAELFRLSVWELTPLSGEHEVEMLWRAFLAQREQRGDYRVLMKNGETTTASYVARAHVLPGLHVSLWRVHQERSA